MITCFYLAMSNKVNKSLFILMLSFFAIFFSGCMLVPTNEKEPRIAILEFEDNSGAKKFQHLRKGIRDMLTTDIQHLAPNISIIERARINDVFRELNFSSNKNFDQHSVAKIGKQLGASHLLTGAYIIDESRRLRIDVRLINVKTGQIDFTHKAEGGVEEFFNIEQQLVFSFSRRFNTAKFSQDKSNFSQTKNVSFDEIDSYSKAVIAVENQNITEAIVLLENLIRGNSDFDLAFQTLSQLEQDSKRQIIAGYNELQKTEREIFIRIDTLKKLIEKKDFSPKYFAALLALSLYNECIDSPAEYTYRKKTGAPLIYARKQLAGMYEKHFAFDSEHASKEEWEGAQKAYELRKKYSRYILLRFWEEWRTHVPVKNSSSMWAKVLGQLKEDDKYFEYISYNMYRVPPRWRNVDFREKINLAQKRYVEPFSMVPPFAALLTRHHWNDSFFHITNLENFYKTPNATKAENYFQYPFYILAFEWIIYEFKLSSDLSNSFPVDSYTEKYQKQRMLSAINCSHSILNYYNDSNILTDELRNYFLKKKILLIKNINLESISNEEIQYIISVLNSSYKFALSGTQKIEIGRLQTMFARLLRKRLNIDSAAPGGTISNDKKIIYIIDSKTIVGREAFRGNDSFDVASSLISESLGLDNKTRFNVYSCSQAPLFETAQFATVENCLKVRKIGQELHNEYLDKYNEKLDNQHAYFKGYFTRLSGYGNFLKDVHCAASTKIILICKQNGDLVLQELFFTPNRLIDEMNTGADWRQNFDSKMRHLILAGVNVNVIDKKGETLLSYFVKNKDVKIVDFLLKNGANIDFADQMENARAKSLSHRRRYLNDSSSMLELAVKNLDASTIGMLLSNNTHKYTSEDLTRAYYAALKNNSFECVEILVKYGANPNKTINSWSKSPLQIVCDHKEENINLINFLLEKKLSPNEVSKYEKNPPLYLATKKQKYDTVVLLLKNDADIKYIDEKGNTLLHVVGDVRMESQKQLKFIKLFVSNGLSLITPNKSKLSPWELCLSKIRYRNKNISLDECNLIDFFLKNGITPLTKNKYGKCLLELVTSREAKLILVRYLIENNNVKDFCGSRGESLSYFAIRNDLVELIPNLLQCDQSFFEQNNNQISAFYLAGYDTRKLILRHAAQIDRYKNYTDARGNSLLHMTAEITYDEQLLQLLLSIGISPFEKNLRGKTAFDLSGYKAKTQILRFASDSEKLKNYTDAEGNSLLHIAANADLDKELIKYLLKKGYSPSAKNKNGKTAKDLATWRVKQLFLNHEKTEK